MKNNVVHHTYQLKQEGAYCIVIRDLHHLVTLEEIKCDLVNYEEIKKKQDKYDLQI